MATERKKQVGKRVITVEQRQLLLWSAARRGLLLIVRAIESAYPEIATSK